MSVLLVSATSTVVSLFLRVTAGVRLCVEVSPSTARLESVTSPVVEPAGAV